MDKAVGEGLAGWLAAAYWVGCRGDAYSPDLKVIL